MQKRIALPMLIFLCILVQNAASILYRKLTTRTNEGFAFQANVESVFSLSKKKNVMFIDEYDLSLIKGLTQKSTREILRDRKKIKAQLEKLPDHEKYKAFLPLTGIAEKKAKYLARFIG